MAKYNKAPILLNEGEAFIDGIKCYDSVKFKIITKPRTWSGRQLGEKTASTRWAGLDITVEMTRRRATKLQKEIIQGYIDSGETPELTIQGVMTDKNSDYYKTYGSETITCVGCVPVSDFSMMEFDSDSTGVKEDTLTFNVKDIV